MGAFTDDAFETGAIILNEVAGLYAGSSTPEVDVPDAPQGSVYFRSNGDRYTRTADTGSGIATDWVREDPDAVAGGGSLQGSWKFSTSTTEANPGSGRLRYDNATPASVTKLFINDTTNAGFDISTIFNNILSVGDKFYMQQADNGANFLIVTIDTITDNTGWFTLDVTVNASGSLPQNNRDIGVVIFTAGGGGVDQDIRHGHTYAVSGEIKIPSGDTNFLVPFYVSLASGQTIDLVKARYSINSGTSATVKLQRNGGDITGYVGISVTTTPAETIQTQALSDNDAIALVVTGVAGTPTNLTFTLIFETNGAVASGSDVGSILFYMDDLRDTNNADWAVNATSLLADDTTNAALRNRRFDQTIEEGAGLSFAAPLGTTSLKLTFVHRAETAPGAARTVGVKLYNRGIADNATVEAWSAGLVLNDLDIPTNEFHQYDTETVTLASLGMIAGEDTQFQLTRIAPTAGTNLAADWDLRALQVEFI